MFSSGSVYVLKAAAPKDVGSRLVTVRATKAGSIAQKGEFGRSPAPKSETATIRASELFRDDIPEKELSGKIEAWPSGRTASASIPQSVTERRAFVARA
jgi:hypothetical protein